MPSHAREWLHQAPAKTKATDTSFGIFKRENAGSILGLYYSTAFFSNDISKEKCYILNFRFKALSFQDWLPQRLLQLVRKTVHAPPASGHWELTWEYSSMKWQQSRNSSEEQDKMFVQPLQPLSLVCVSHRQGEWLSDHELWATLWPS